VPLSFQGLIRTFSATALSMTTAKKNVLTGALLAVFVPMLAFVFATGAASRELADKESSAAHATDVRDVRDSVRAVMDSLREERRARQNSVYRDSLRYETILSRVTDASCDQNPRRRYCR
jgi:hypothetical protein